MSLVFKGITQVICLEVSKRPSPLVSPVLSSPSHHPSSPHPMTENIPLFKDCFNLLTKIWAVELEGHEGTL